MFEKLDSEPVKGFKGGTKNAPHLNPVGAGSCEDHLKQRTYTKADFNSTFCAKMVAQYGNAREAAVELAPHCRSSKNGTQPVSYRTVEDWFTEAKPEGERLSGSNAAGARILKDAQESDDINRLRNLLAKANVPIEAIGSIKNVRLTSHGTAMKLVTRDAKSGKVIEEKPHVEVAHSTSIVLSPTWDDGPKWPLVRESPRVDFKVAAPLIWIPKGLRYEIVSPDKQIGYTRDLDSRTFENGRETYNLLTIHDDNALDVAEQLVADIQPDGYTDVGDIVDFNEFSKYLQVEEFFRTTQAGIDRAGKHLAAISASLKPKMVAKKVVSPKKRLVEGNHDGKRLANYIQQNARAAFGLRPANSTPETWPDLTLQRLLRTDEYGFQTCGMWPGSEAWLIEGEGGLVVVHDPRQHGDYFASVISGHTHHYRVESRSTRTPYNGYLEYMHHEIGCLCSLETIKDKKAIQRTRVPSPSGHVKNWSQGIALVEILEETRQFQLQFIRIQKGVAQFQGKVFKSRLIS